MKIWSVHLRMAELWRKKKAWGLTQAEEKELDHCLEANANKAWKLARLKNLSLLASLTNDTDEQHRLCQQIEKEYPYGRYAL